MIVTGIASAGERWTELQHLFAGQGVVDNAFGQTVAVSIGERRAIVSGFGEAQDESDISAAFIFERAAADTWELTSTIELSGGGVSNSHGHSLSVSIDTDTAIIGTPFAVVDGQQTGAAYIFVRNLVGDWNQVAKLTAGDGEAFDQFGITVAISERHAVVGAPSDDDNGGGSGSAYVFEKDQAGGWNLVSKLTASDGNTMELFGNSVCLSEGQAIVGAPGDEQNGRSSGSAYVFEGDQMGNWNEVAKLTASDGAAEDEFGLSVSMYSDTVIVGARGSVRSGMKVGSAYVFVRDDSGHWQERTQLHPSDGGDLYQFGHSVSMYESRAVVGAPYDDGKGLYSGAAYVFERDSYGRWAETAQLRASNGGERQQFGQSVAAFEDWVIVGAFRSTENGLASGAYVFQRTLPE